MCFRVPNTESKMNTKMNTRQKTYEAGSTAAADLMQCKLISLMETPTIN